MQKNHKKNYIHLYEFMLFLTPHNNTLNNTGNNIMTKKDIYNTLKARQLHHAIAFNRLILKSKTLKGSELENVQYYAKLEHIRSTALLGAINALLGDDYKGHNVLTPQNELLFEQWSELEKERLGL